MGQESWKRVLSPPQTNSVHALEVNEISLKCFLCEIWSSTLDQQLLGYNAPVWYCSVQTMLMVV